MLMKSRSFEESSCTLSPIGADVGGVERFGVTDLEGGVELTGVVPEGEGVAEAIW